MDNKYYKHEGDFSLAGTLLSFAIGLFAGLALAAIYAYLTLYIPFILLRLLLTLGFGIALGKLMGYALKTSNVRNNYVSIGVISIVTLISIYFSWSVWLFALLRKQGEDVSLLLIALLPHIQFKIMMSIEYSSASLSSMAPSVRWLGEVAIILGAAIFTTLKDVTDPFCEQCNVWCEKEPCVMELAIGDNKELKLKLEEKDFQYLGALGRRLRGRNKWYQLDIFSCPKCSLLNTLVVSTVTEINNNGRLQEQYKRIIKHLLITADEVALLKKLSNNIWLPEIPLNQLSEPLLPLNPTSPAPTSPPSE